MQEHVGGMEISEEPPMSRLLVICGWPITKEQLIHHFQDDGQIEECVVIVDKKTGQDTGMAYVKFTKTSSAARGLRKNGTFIENDTHPIEVTISASYQKKKEDGALEEVNEYEFRRMFAVVPSSKDVESIKEEFSRFGSVTQVQLVLDKKNQSQCTAYITFTSFLETALAIEGCDPSYTAMGFMLKDEYPTDYTTQQLGSLSLRQENPQCSSDNRQSGRDNSAQQQQINLHSSDCVDSDDEREKNTELFSVIKNGNFQKVQDLLKAGVKVNIIDKNNKDNTPLHYAIERGKQEIAEKLLQEWKADINAKNIKGDTPLHIATSKGNKELVHLLLSKNAKIDVKNNEDKTPLDAAKHLKRQDIVEVLKSYIQPNLPTYNGEQSANWQQRHVFFHSKSSSGLVYNTQSSNNQPKKPTSNPNSGKYKIQKRQGTTGSLDGHFYEIDLLILGKLRGDRDLSKFYLATNIDGLGAFDDVVIKYWNNKPEEQKSTTILLQAKHVDDPKKGKVTIEKFKNAKNDKFYLGKYFSDYLNSREKFKDKSKDPVFKGNFQEIDLKYIIYTNAILDERFDKNRKIDIDNIIFSTKSKANKDKAFKFSLDDKNPDLIAMLENVSCQQRIKLLAKTIVSCISGKLNYNNMMGNEFFSTYHVFLAKNVIDVGEEIKEDKKKNKYREGKIDRNFLIVDKEDLFKTVLKEEVLYEYGKNVIFNEKSYSGLDDEDERNNFVNKVAESLKLSKKVDEDVIEKLGGYVIILDTKKKLLKFADHEEIKDESAKQFMRDLKSKVSNLADYKIDFPYEFVKNTLKVRTEKDTLKLHVSFGNIRPSFKKPDHLVKQLIELFEKHKSQKIITIDDNAVGHGKSLTAGDVKNIGKLVGNLLTFDEKEKMLRFASEAIFDGDTLEFITNLKRTAQSRDLEILSYRFDIKVTNNFPRETLVTDDEDRLNVKKFLSKLEVFTGQASDQELRETIKHEMKDLHKLTVKEVEENFFKIRDKAEKHWRAGEYYLEKNDDFLKHIVKFDINFNVKEPVELFTGRKQMLSDLHSKIQRNSERATVISHITCICGMGGMGKTELARKYACDYRKHYDGNVVWIDAENYGTLKHSFVNLARDIGLTIHTRDVDEKEAIASVVAEIYRFFARRKSLFIFDNAEKNEDLNKFLPLRSLTPDCEKPYILITSQNREWENSEIISLNELGLKDAIELVKKGLSIEDDTQDQQIKALVEKLQRFPLAITQAIAYIKDQRVTGEFGINDYLKEYETKADDLLKSKIFKGIDNDYEKTTFTTWEIATNRIASDKDGRLALKILDIMAYFAPESINREIFLDLAEGHEVKLKSAFRLLAKYSLVAGEQKQSVLSIHRLVQEVTRINLKDREKEVLEEALGLFHDHSEPINVTTMYLENSHLSNVDHAISVWSFANKYEELGMYFSYLPALITSELNATLRFQEAYLFGSNALELLEKIFGGNHPCVLFMMNKIAFTLYTQGNDNESLEMYRNLHEQKITIPKCVYIHFETMIGLILNRQGKYDEALEIFYRLYSLMKEGKIDSDGSIEHNLGVTLFYKNKFDDSFEMYKNALKRKKEELGSDHVSTFNTENSMAAILGFHGKHDEALQKYEAVYENRKRILGSNHPDTLSAYGNIAYSLNKLGRYDEALIIANKVAEEIEYFLPDHPHTLQAKCVITDILDDQGRYEEALEKCKEVHEKRKEILWLKHPDILTSLQRWFDLAVKLANQRKYEKALLELKEVLEERAKILEPNDPRIFESKDAIGKVRRSQDNGTDLKIINLELLLAAEKGQWELVDDLLNNGADSNVDTFGEHITPLHLAAQNGITRIVEKLLQKGAEVNAKNANGSTALHIAARRDHFNVVNALLKGGADVNCFDNALFRPLHCAAQEGRFNIVELLLKNGADIEATNDEGRTSLIMAVLHKYFDVVKILLEGGANVEATDIHGKKALFYATDLVRDDLVINILTSTHYMFTTLKNNNLEEDKKVENLKTCIKQGAIGGASDNKNGFMLLHYAAQKNYKKIVDLLLKNGVDPTRATISKGNTPLHLAVSKGNMEIVKTLVEHVKQTNPDKLSDFINAKTTAKGTTSLHVASQNNNQKIVEVLLKNGAYYGVKNTQGKTPLDLAKTRPDVENLLDYIDQLFQAVRDVKKDIVNSLLEGKDSDTLIVILHARNTDDQTLKQVAGADRQRDIMKLLEEKLRLIQSTDK